MADSVLAPLPDVQPPLKFPYCLVWTQIPFISWLMPMIGHVGLCDSAGTIHDFQASQTISTGELLFGRPLKYWQLAPSDAAGLVTDAGTTDIRSLELPWDEAVGVAKRTMQQCTYNLFTQNCHSFAACLLSQIQYGGSSNWSTVQIAAALFCYGRYVDRRAHLRNVGPCLGIILVTALFLSWKVALAHVLLLSAASLYLRFRLVAVKRDTPAIYRAATV